MGSFNTSCALTHEIIDGQTEVVALMLTKKPYSSGMPVHSWDIYAPVPILFEGFYNSYGSLENLKLFQSKEVFSENERKALEEALFIDLQTVMASDQNPNYPEPPADTLEKLIMDRDVYFAKKDRTIDILKEVLKMADMTNHPPEGQETVNNILQTYLKMFGFSTIDEIREHVKNTEAKIQKVPVSFMMFRKDAFMKLMNEYGMHSSNEQEPEDDEDEDSFDNENYSVKIQHMRSRDMRFSQSEDISEAVNFVNNAASYSGANRPEYTLEHAIKGTAKKSGQVREDLIVLKKMHSLDISLLNDYFTLLGMTYLPSMYVSEEIRSYGFTEAFAMQQALLESVKPKSKNTP